jgi:dCMP deaminase
VQSIIQVGIKRVVYLDKKAHQDRVNGASEKMLADAGVEIESLQSLQPESADWSAELAQFIETSTSTHSLRASSKTAKSSNKG